MGSKTLMHLGSLAVDQSPPSDSIRNFAIMKLHRTAFLAVPILSSLSAFESLGIAQDALSTDRPLPIRWEIEPLTLDANEGCAIADINGDSKPDIVAGRH